MVTRPAKGRPHDPEERLRTIIDRTVSELMAFAEQLARQRAIEALQTGSGGVRAYRRRAAKNCPVPGCTRPFAPRYGGFCPQHKLLPEDEKARYKAIARGEKPQRTPVKAKRGRGRKARKAA